VATTGTPMIMSTGMASADEIDEAVTTARAAGCKDLVWLHCINSYPEPMNQAHLREIPELSRG
jgi:N-acetylneuraminate synthase